MRRLDVVEPRDDLAPAVVVGVVVFPLVRGLLSLTALVLRTRRPTRPSPATASTATVLRRLLRRQIPEETSHRAADLGLHQLTNDRDDALASRHPHLLTRSE
jgi:hypothetical protein